jgi:hypothetical protein
MCVRRGDGAGDHAGMTADWFPGEGRAEDDASFLAELRACADECGLVDAAAEDTSLHVWDDDVLVLLVAVPGLQEGPVQPTLEVISHGPGGRDLSSGSETYGHLADGYDQMDLKGVEPTPRGLARHAFDWFHAQLRRPVEQLEWTSGPWRPRLEWRLGEPDEPFEVIRSGWPFRRWRGEPDRITRLR